MATNLEPSVQYVYVSMATKAKLCSGFVLIHLGTNLSDLYTFCLCLECFDTVGWVAGRASGL